MEFTERSLKLRAKASENRPNAPKGKEKVFQPSIFRCYVNFRDGICGKIIKLIMDHTRPDMGNFILVS